MEEQDTAPEETIEDEVENQTEVETDVKTKSPKKKHRLLKTLGIIVIIIAIIVVSLGFVFPGLLWTKDLGVRYTEADYKSFMAKLEYIKDAVPTGDSKDGYTYTEKLQIFQLNLLAQKSPLSLILGAQTTLQ